MLPKIIPISVCLLTGTSVQAAPKYATSWMFRATYESGEMVESVNTSDEETIVPWTGSIWTCKKEIVTYSSKKNYVGGFSCKNIKGGFITVYASCATTKVSSDANAASVGDPNGYITLVSICSTSEIPVPAKGSDRNL